MRTHLLGGMLWLAAAAVPGGAVAQAAGGVTTVAFRVEEGEAPLTLYRWSEGADDYQLLCTTPCEMPFPAGSYDLRAGDTYEFPLTPWGTGQTWQVEDTDTTTELVGVIATGLGVTAMMFGGIWSLLAMEAFDYGRGDDTTMVGWNTLIVGAVVTVGGVAAWALSSGSARLVEGTPAPGTSTVADADTPPLLPALAVVPGPSAAPALALGAVGRF